MLDCVHGVADVEDLFNGNESDTSSPDGMLGAVSGITRGRETLAATTMTNSVGYMGVGGVMQTDNRPPSPDNSVHLFTNVEVMKFPFVECVCHYMVGALIGISNHSGEES